MLQKISTGSLSEQNDTKSLRGVYSKNRFNFNATNYINSIVGVNITKIFGISEILALDIISETGIDMSKWPTKKHFTSWLNLVPNNRISGGKQLKSKKVKKKNKAGQAFLMAAFSIQRSNNWLGSFHRRMKAKHGPGIATKATARKIALVFYDMIKFHKEFDPINIETYDQIFADQKIKYIKNQALKLGLKLVSA